MANRRKERQDYVKEPSKQITLSISISQYQLLEQFTEGTNRPMVDVVSQVFSDTAIVSIRRMLAANTKPNITEKYASKAPANLVAAQLPPPAMPPLDLQPPVVDQAVFSTNTNQPPQEQPMPPAAPLQSSHQPPSVPPSRPASPLVAPHSRPENNSPVPSGSRPTAFGPQSNSLPPLPSPTRSLMPPLQSSTKPTDEPSFTQANDVPPDQSR